MPLVYQQNINAESRLALWQISEDESFFRQKVSLVNAIKHPHKRLQHLAGRYLLDHLFPGFPLENILISATNKPYLESEDLHFSISHCGNHVAAIISSAMRAGVDIELKQEKILRVSHKFISQEDFALTSIEELDYFLLAWAVKEAIFKWYGTGSVDFKEHIRINQVVQTGDSYHIHCIFLKGVPELLNVHARFLGKLCLAWVLAP